MRSLKRPELVEASHVSLFTREAGGHERAQQLAGQRRADDAAAQDGHVHLVALSPADRGPGPAAIAARLIGIRSGNDIT